MLAKQQTVRRSDQTGDQILAKQSIVSTAAPGHTDRAVQSNAHGVRCNVSSWATNEQTV